MYSRMLERDLLNQDEKMAVLTVFFRNTSIHSAKDRNKWFEDNNIHKLDWPVNNLDLNPMENVWGFIERNIFQKKKKCQMA